MGAWGIKPFENDGAGDFEAELCLFHPDDPDLEKKVLLYFTLKLDEMKLQFHYDLL